MNKKMHPKSLISKKSKPKIVTLYTRQRELWNYSKEVAKKKRMSLSRYVEESLSFNNKFGVEFRLTKDGFIYRNEEGILTHYIM